MTTVTKKLSRYPYGNAKVRLWDDGSKSLISYTTTVLEIDKDGWLIVYGLYSATTRKHIAAFVNEFVSGLHYYDIKQCYTNNYKLNIYTGEIMEL